MPTEMPEQQNCERDDRGNDLTSNEVFIVRTGLLNMWVCAPKTMSRDEVQAFIDRKAESGDIHSGWVSGTSAGWQVKEKADGEWNKLSPGYCAENPDRQHWNCVC